jgi:hypothetical protein
MTLLRHNERQQKAVDCYQYDALNRLTNALANEKGSVLNFVNWLIVSFSPNFPRQ